MKTVEFRGHNLPVDNSVVAEYMGQPKGSIGRQVWADCVYYGAAIAAGKIQNEDLLAVLLMAHRSGGEHAYLHGHAELEETLAAETARLRNSANWANAAWSFVAGVLATLLVVGLTQ